MILQDGTQICVDAGREMAVGIRLIINKKREPSHHF